MNISFNVAKHLREVFFGGNWSVSSFKEHLSDISWQQAITKVDGVNTIATLTFHTGYYITALIKVLEGGALEASDALSFDHPLLNSESDWQQMLSDFWTNAEKLATLIEQLPDDKWIQNLSEEKYGSYYRNLHGIIEHAHYHLGQLVLVKKLVNKIPNAN